MAKKFLKLLLVFNLSLLSLPGPAQEVDDNLEAEVQPESQVEVPPEPDFKTQLEKFGYKEVNLKSLTDDRVVKLIRDGIRNNPLKVLPPEEVKTLILDKAGDSKMGELFKSKPKLLDVCVKLLRDDEALYKATGILVKKKDFRTYVFIWLAIMFVGWFIRRYYFSPKWSLGKRLGMSLSLTLILSMASFGAFLYLFQEELMPAIQIIINGV